MTAIVISNQEMNGNMKIDKSLEESGLLIKGGSEIIQNEANDQKGGHLEILKYITCYFIKYETNHLYSISDYRVIN